MVMFLFFRGEGINFFWVTTLMQLSMVAERPIQEQNRTELIGQTQQIKQHCLCNTKFLSYFYIPQNLLARRKDKEYFEMVLFPCVAARGASRSVLYIHPSATSLTCRCPTLASFNTYKYYFSMECTAVECLKEVTIGWSLHEQQNTL